MKRIWLVILILAAGTAAFCALYRATANARVRLVAETAAAQGRDRELARLRLEKQQVLEHVNETRTLVAAQRTLPAASRLEEKILSGSAPSLSATEAEQLLAELDLNWNTTGDYVIVSKKSLENISFGCFRGTQLSAVARDVFAITPGEQADLEAMTRQMSDRQAAWAGEQVQRLEPGGDVVAEYSLPADPSFSRSQLAMFTNGLFSVLGPERGQGLESHSSQWMQDFGLQPVPDFSDVPPEVLAAMPPGFNQPQPQPTTLKVERYQSGDGEWRLNYTLEQAGGSMTASVTPWQPFPLAFRALFPGGWPDLAQCEGFELPKEFQKP